MIGLIVVVALLGFVTWAIVSLVPMPERIKQIVIVVAVICIVFYVLGAFGILPLHDVSVPQLR